MDLNDLNIVGNNLNNNQFLDNIDAEGPLNLSEEEDLHDLNLPNPELGGYTTDSDIEDPKYIPSGNMFHGEDNINNINNINNLDNFAAQSQNEMLLQTQIMNLENDTMLANKTLQQLENENDQLKAQLMKNQEKMESKEGINNEFKQLFGAFKQRFAQYEKRNDFLQKYIYELEEKLKQKDKELAESQKDKSKSEAAMKNASIYKQYVDELQNEFKEKSKKLNQKYIDKEKTLKDEFLEEINKNIQKIEDLKIENEKLKFDLSNYKMNIETLHHQLEEKDNDKDSTMNQKEKEIEYLKEKINEREKEIDKNKNNNKEQLSKYEEQVKEAKEENDNLLNEINILRSEKKENDIKMNNYKHNIQMLNNELNQNKTTISNKDSIIEQLTFQIDEMKRAIEQRDIDVQKYDQEKQNEINDYSNQIEQIIQENNALQAQNAELTENLSLANDGLKQFNELIAEKYSSLEDELNKQVNDNNMIQKKYKEILKKLKMKQNNLSKENNNLKLQINNQEFSVNNALVDNFGSLNINNNQLNKTMMNLQPTNVLNNNSFMLDNNNINIQQRQNVLNNTFNIGNNTQFGTNLKSNYNINNYLGMFSSFQNIEDDNDNDNNQRHTLDEFKKLLRKIDQKLETPILDNRNTNI